MSANDGYRIIRPLGSSSAGTVYLAETAQGLIAVRQFESSLEPGTPFRQTDRERFLEAGRRAQALTHPRILAVLEVIDEAGEAFVTSEYVEGETLQSALASRRFSIEEANDILGQVALALDFAHSRGVAHGDLKPSEIYLVPKQGVRVADFGISPLAHWDTRRPVPVNLLNEFLSPEHVRDPGSVDGRSDQYSLAVIAYWMFTGQSPYGQAGADPAAAILAADPVPPSRLDQRLPASFDGPILKALDRNPARRFDSCRKFIGSLGAGLIPPQEVVVRRQSRAAAWVAGGLVALLAALGYLALKGRSGRPTVSGTTQTTLSELKRTVVPTETKRSTAQRPAAGPSLNTTSRPNPFGQGGDRPKAVPAAPTEPKVSAPKEPSAPPPPMRHTPIEDPGAPFAIQVFSRENPLSEGQQFALLDPTYGEMGFGDLKAIVSGNNSLAARGRVGIEWAVDGIRHDSCGMQHDSCTVRLNEAVTYRNQPAHGIYEVILTLDRHPVRSFSFQITP